MCLDKMSESPEGFLAVDVGNSSTKVGYFRESSSLEPTWVARISDEASPPATLIEALPNRSVRWLVASVHRERIAKLSNWVARHRSIDKFESLTYRSFPIQIETKDPASVGLDRLASAAAANQLRSKEQAAIVIDSGTAITVDLLSKNGAYQGGAILPGVRMVARALATGADLLPLIENGEGEGQPNPSLPVLVGKDTAECIRSGLFWGTLGAVREITSGIRQTLDHEPAIFITGGETKPFQAWQEPSLQFVPHLVLAGIALTARP